MPTRSETLILVFVIIMLVLLFGGTAVLLSNAVADNTHCTDRGGVVVLDANGRSFCFSKKALLP